MPLKPLSQCETCSSIPPDGYSDPQNILNNGQRAFRANVCFEMDGRTPTRVTQFLCLNIWDREDYTDYNHYRCQLCGAYYRHEYHYDSGGGVGPSYETQELIRLGPNEIRAVLKKHQKTQLLRVFEESLFEMKQVSLQDLESENVYAKIYARQLQIEK